MPKRLDLILGKTPAPGSDGEYLMKIAAKAREMRDVQKSYFKSRTVEKLEISRAVERLLDALLDEETKAPDLFRAEGEDA